MDFNTAGAGFPIKKYSLQFNNADAANLKSIPFNLLAGIPTLTYGFIPLIVLFSGSVQSANIQPVYLGNPTLLNNSDTQCYCSFDLSLYGTGDTFNLILGQFPAFNQLQSPNAIRDYNPTLTTPGTNTFYVWQGVDEGKQWGGIFTLYYLDQPLY